MNENISKALVRAQAEMPTVPMNATNPFLKNRYADLGSVIETVRPVLAKHGLAFSQMPVGIGGEVGIKTILIHESGEFFESTITLPLANEKGKSAAQVAGSIITYLRRYSLNGILGIYADEDNDGNQPAAKKKAPPAQVAVPTGETKIFVTLATAEKVTGSDGVAYGDKDTETLSHMWNAIQKAMKDDDKADKLEEYQFKADAIQTILNDRSKQE